MRTNSNSFQRLCRYAAGLGGIATTGCHAPAAPAEPATLLVTNATCLQGTCEPIEVRVFPSNQPHTPGGFWSVQLGSVAGEEACLTIPSAATFRITAVGPGGGRVTTIEWNTSMAASLGAGAVGTAPIPGIRPSTSEFVPSTAGGWRATLPADASTAVSPAEACRPE